MLVHWFGASFMTIGYIPILWCADITRSYGPNWHFTWNDVFCFHMKVEHQSEDLTKIGDSCLGINCPIMLNICMRFWATHVERQGPYFNQTQKAKNWSNRIHSLATSAWALQQTNGLTREGQESSKDFRIRLRRRTGDTERIFHELPKCFKLLT